MYEKGYGKVSGYQSAMWVIAVALGMKEVTDAIGNIHKVETEYKQEGVTCLPSYQALQEQLEMLDKLSDSMKDIMMLVTQSVTNAYTALLSVDAQAAEDMNK